MKKVILLLSLLCWINLLAQESTKNEAQFVRVFDLDGKKIGKGHIYTMTDSILVLKKKESSKKISMRGIGKIKTKHSGGHNFLVGAASGVLVGAILGAVNPPTEDQGGTFTWAGGSAGEELTSGIATGVFFGTIIGGISALFKNSKTYNIDGNSEKWKDFIEAVKDN